MGAEHLKILIVEDEAAHVEAISRAFEAAKKSVEIRVAGTLREYRRFVTEFAPDIALLDLNLPDGRATEVLTHPPEDAAFPILIMTAYGNEQMAVEAIKAGALDYVVKSPEAFTSMPRALERALREWNLLQEHRIAVKALRTSERQYRQLVENSLVGVYRSTPAGKFLYVNDALARIFECVNADEMLQLPVEMRYKSPEDRKAFLNILNENGNVPYYETEVPTKTGNIKTIVISAVTVDGIITGMVSDITERKQLESQLRHAQKMEAVGTLAGGIAHDFNNILNVIIGYGSMVQDGLEAGSPAKEQMQEVLGAAEKAANLTKRLLLFSRKTAAEFIPMALNEMVINMEKMLSRIIGEDINLVADLMGAKAMVMADAGQMEQVLLNLATNARDAMPEGGSLTIKTELKNIDTEFIKAYEYGVPGTYAVISITDTGTGIDKEKQARIFDPFFTTKEVGKGTGLGLSIVYGIIKQHNGYIKAYSETGKGTTFKIWLPVIEDIAEKKPEAGALSSPKGGTETILVAEDDASLRKLTRVVLESFGYTVITAEDGEDAITKFMENRENIQLVVLDMIMPKKNGKEVGETIRKESPPTKILFVSGYTMDTIKTQELTEAGFDFILKPVIPKDLLKKVREILDRC